MHLKEARALAETTIRSDLIRGSIDAMLLRVLSAHDSYGYEIIKTIAQRTGGRYELKEPSLYTSLKRLERDGCVQSYWGDASQGARRKYYRITPAGAALLHDAVEQWRAARDIIDCVLIGGEEHG